MKITWTRKAVSDLGRLYDFLAVVNKAAAVRTMKTLSAAPEVLLAHPRLGEQLFQYLPKEIRRLQVGHYEMRYEIFEDTIFVLRLWHTREDR